MTEVRESPRTGATGVVAIAATYVFFLIFAQFAFLDRLREVLNASQVRVAMGAMGIAGLLASLATASLLARLGSRTILRSAYGFAAVTAILSVYSRSFATLLPVAALIGGVTAVLTVSLATDLSRLTGARRFGLKTGIGTGIAYFLCNLPFIFEASVATRSFFAAGIALVGALVIHLDREPDEIGLEVSLVPDSSFRVAGFSSIVLGFLALIWFDSAAFAIVQESALKAQTWSTPEQKLLMGTTHLVAAIIAGALIDRLALRSLLPSSFLLFATAFWMLGRPEWSSEIAGPIYAIGISSYSTALVAFPSSGPETRGSIPRRWRAAILYGVAGWLGSALGVGMAQDLGAVPDSFIVAAGLVIFAGWALSHPPLLRTVAIAAAVPVLLAFGGFVATLSGSAPSGIDPVERGHQVYLNEGCINCHSQYVRPGDRDENPWGPYRGLDRSAQPPVPGNRRQGPDLQNVGNRRSAKWQRLHLISPSSLVPTSRMPSYAHLFEQGSTKGDDLVAYLRSLGGGTVVERAEKVRRIPASGQTSNGNPVRGSALFSRNCAQCHGLHGHGDGQLLADAPTEPRDLLKSKWWFVSRGENEPEAEALARVIRYGLPGMTMPGHETWSSRDVEDVVAWVRAMRAHDKRHRIAGGR